MTEIERLADGYIAAWNERDTEARAKALSDVFAPDARYTDPLGETSGREAISAAIAGAQAQFPGLIFTRGPVDAHHDIARFNWSLGSPEGGDPLVVGFDVVYVAQGKIARVYGFLDKVPAVAESAG